MGPCRGIGDDCWLPGPKEVLRRIPGVADLVLAAILTLVQEQLNTHARFLTRFEADLEVVELKAEHYRTKLAEASRFDSRLEKREQI